MANMLGVAREEGDIGQGGGLRFGGGGELRSGSGIMRTRSQWTCSSSCHGCPQCITFGCAAPCSVRRSVARVMPEVRVGGNMEWSGHAKLAFGRKDNRRKLEKVDGSNKWVYIVRSTRPLRCVLAIDRQLR